jgi:cyclopropane-fatty-acyl-phospholipid synthase
MSVVARRSSDAAATSLAFLQSLFAEYQPRDFRVELWDGTTWEPETDEARFTLRLKKPNVLRAFLGASERALAEAYIHDELDIEGDVYAAIAAADHVLLEREWTRAERARQAARLLSLPRKNANGNGHAAATLRGRRFSLSRDRQAVTYHYDRSNEFFALWLDPRMTYSCAYWGDGVETIDEAQERKLDLICRKLRLRPGERVLDIGCGWGSFVVYAAERFGVEVLGVTLSENQADCARKRIRAAGLEDRARIEVRDYRELEGRERFDKIASIGMFEHVAPDVLPRYFAHAHELLKPRGAFLNQGIARPIERKERSGESFLLAYVYPDAELSPISTALRAAESAGFEVRDVESLREHYPLTLRAWLGRLEAAHEEAVRAAGEETYRVFRLYLAGSAHGFETNRISIFQTLLVKPERGASGLPLTREDWYG